MRLEEIYALNNQHPNVALRQLFNYTESCIAKEDIDALNDLLKQYDPSRMCHRFSIAMLRGLFRMRRLLPQYDACFERVKEYLEQQKVEHIQHLMRGLF